MTKFKFPLTQYYVNTKGEKMFKADEMAVRNSRELIFFYKGKIVFESDYYRTYTERLDNKTIQVEILP